MTTRSEDIKVIAADVSRGDLLVHFSDGTSVLFQAHFLSDMRNNDGNTVLIEDSKDDEDEQ